MQKNASNYLILVNLEPFLHFLEEKVLYDLLILYLSNMKHISYNALYIRTYEYNVVWSQPTYVGTYLYMRYVRVIKKIEKILLVRYGADFYDWS